jgi:acyl-CoA thioesterase
MEPMAVTGNADGEPARTSERIAAFNASDFARLLGMTILEARDGYARVAMECAGKTNPHNVAHGSAVFSLADHAFGIAANCGPWDRVAVSVHIQYLVPANGSLVAIAEMVSDNGTQAVFRVMVYEGQRIVAQFDGVAMRV